jgi:hypothetical protein
MFAVLGYQTSDEDVQATLETVRTHLVPGGPFIFDVWYGPAVEAVGPEPRIKVIHLSDGQIERHAAATLDPQKRVCTVAYRLVRRIDGMPDHTSNEVHRMRYFAEDELLTALKARGMTLISIAPFPEIHGRPSASSWNVVAVAHG